MNRGLEKAQDLLLERINQICRAYALNNIMAQLYTILYLSNKPLSLDDMMERLKISKGSVSVNIRALERYGVVHRIWVKGSRRDYYEAEKNIAKVILDRIKSMANRRLYELEEMINSANQMVNSATPNNKEEKEDIKVFRERLDEFKKLHNKAQSLFDLFNSNLVGGLLKLSGRKNNKEAGVYSSNL